MSKPLEAEYVTIDRTELRRLQQLDLVCEGLTQDHIDGGWTALGISAHCAKAETSLANAAARNRKLEGLLLWTLYHHQGGKSDIGQPIRAALGIGEHDELTPGQIDQAKAAASGLNYHCASGAIDFLPPHTLEQRYHSLPPSALDVINERTRQVEAEGWKPEHDDEHYCGQMARAAACYALSGSTVPDDETAAMLVDLAWPWEPRWWKPTTNRRDLVKAGALILAEIERLDRVEAKEGQA